MSLQIPTASEVAIVMGNIREVDVIPVCDTSGAYTAGDVLFDVTEIGNIVKSTDGYAFLVGLTITDEDDNTAAGVTLHFFSGSATLGTPNAAPSMSDANSRQWLGSVTIASGDWIDIGGVKLASKTIGDAGMPLLLVPKSSTRSVYVAATCAGTPTQTASGIKLRLFAEDRN